MQRVLENLEKTSQHSWMSKEFSRNTTICKTYTFSNLSCMFLNPNNFFQFEFEFLYLLDMRSLQEQVKKAFCYQKLFWPFTVWINCSSDLKKFSNSRPSASNFSSFSRSLEQFFLTVGQNNFGNKIQFLKFEHVPSMNFRCYCMGKFLEFIPLIFTLCVKKFFKCLLLQLKCN